MTGDKDLVANNLSDVFELTLSEKRTGLLSVEYAQRGVLEVGEIYFQAGRPIYARTKYAYGRDALEWMSRWQPIYLRFVNNAPMPQANPGAYSANPPNRAFPARIPLSPLPTEPTTGSFRADPTTGPLDREVSHSAALESLVPRKLALKQDIFSLPLTRRQRLVYMLVNDRRNIADLARCANKNLQEVERILIELQEQHLITM